MTRRDWLILFFGLKGAPEGLDPVRIQKGMFLFAMEGGVAEAERYDFRAYNYGPMSSQLYGDVDALEQLGYITGDSVPGYTWRRYRATDKGYARAAELRDSSDSPEAVQRLYEIKNATTRLSFSALLDDVYERYPAFATKSVFRQS